jgi:uncharacterized protein YyaL (SSP411 family)
LVREKSPYLLQHAHNPVDWYPWGEEAFETAREADKPIFLSIGYATCHWCHVMERESFENDEVARLLNDAFVNVKVDREERPDVDGIYMTVAQRLTGQGGWPLTILMTPDRHPFFAATYIPRENRFGRLGMINLIPRIRNAWTTNRDALVATADAIVEDLGQMATAEHPSTPLDESTLELGFQELLRSFDREHAGFGRAPKFPTPHLLLFLLRYWHRTQNGAALEMVQATLAALRAGGIFDQVGFGFHRYSTDPRWLVPHFEKMLYDQALLVLAYSEALQAGGSPAVERTIRQTLSYVQRDLTAPDGGFFSAEDADSEGEEGKFYIWTHDELRDALGADAEVAIAAWGVEEGGNFTEEATGRRQGTNILHLGRPLPRVAAELEISHEDLASRLESARMKLLAQRGSRIRPLLDDKILTDWTGLMIAALARAGSVLHDPSYVEAARRAAQFLDATMWTDGGLLHRFRGGDAGIAGNVDDYAFLAWGRIELYQATLLPEHLRRAVELTETMLDRFWDGERGGLFFSPADRSDLIVRQREIYDGAIPSGNSVAMYNLLRLSRLTGVSRYDQNASELANAFSREVAGHPSAHGLLLCALDFAIGPSQEVVIAGDADDDVTRQMIETAKRAYHPNRVVLHRPEGDDPGPIGQLAPFVRELGTQDGRPTAYLCHNFRCERPVTDAAELAQVLAAGE